MLNNSHLPPLALRSGDSSELGFEDEGQFEENFGRGSGCGSGCDSGCEGRVDNLCFWILEMRGSLNDLDDGLVFGVMWERRCILILGKCDSS